MVAVNVDRLKEMNAHFVQPLVAGATSTAVIALGHQFAVFATTAIWHGGLFGLFQNAIAHQISHTLKLIPTRNNLVSYVVSHIISGAILYGLSLLALKVGLIASAITVSAAITLSAVSAMMGMVAILGGNSAAERICQK